MKAEKKTWTTRFCRRHAVLSAAVIACCCSMMLGCKKASEPAAPAAKIEDAATRDLRTIGDRAVTAVAAKDINTLLEYDHDPEDEASLKNKSGDLYCYLFDSTCIQGAKTRAIFEILSTSRQLGIDASVVNVQGRQYGLLMFYDKSQVSGTELYTPDFLCSDKALKGTASWHFILANGKWSTSTLFDYKTERPCKQ
jgi:hypothetical protein